MDGEDAVHGVALCMGRDRDYMLILDARLRSTWDTEQAKEYAAR